MLMSATLDAGKYANFFPGAKIGLVQVGAMQNNDLQGPLLGMFQLTSTGMNDGYSMVQLARFV